jgi:FKBP-type peptidyl-prolyl cis-trans isomerase
MPSPTRRPLRLAAIAAALVPLALAGCTASKSSSSSSSGAGASSSAASSATPSATATPLSCASSGTASEAVTVSGKFGTAPKVSFKAPLTTTSTQRSTVITGKGATVKPGDALTVGLVGYDARTGKQLAGSAYGTASLAVDATRYIPGLARSLDCTKVGERFASVVPASEAFGTAGSSSIGVKGGDSLVFIVDVKSITPTKASGASKSLPSGFPTVKLASDGKPTVTIPKATAPKTLRIAEMKTGTGAVVKSTDQVTVQYQGVLWRTGKVFDQSWGQSPATFLPSQVVPGFGKALIGHRVGSQVVAIVPPKDGYGSAGSSGAGIKGTDTMVFVVDILSATSAG